MSQHENVVCLKHMLDHALEALEMVGGKKREDLDKDRKLNLSLVRLLEIIGEAASRISREDQKQYPDIPWPEVISLRNRLIHGYDQVDFDILWEILTKDIPVLINPLKKIISR